MPITPLHFGLMAPVNQVAPKKLSLVSFILVNLWMDAEAIEAVLLGQPLPGHGAHTFVIASAMFLVVGGLGMRSRKWLWGAWLGAYSHILLDGMVHTDMEPFEPFIEGNPLYLGILEPLSIALMPLTAWLVIQVVRQMTTALSESNSRGWIARARRAIWRGRSPRQTHTPQRPE